MGICSDCKGENKGVRVGLSYSLDEVGHLGGGGVKLENKKKAQNQLCWLTTQVASAAPIPSLQRGMKTISMKNITTLCTLHSVPSTHPTVITSLHPTVITSLHPGKAPTCEVIVGHGVWIRAMICGRTCSHVPT